MAGIYLHIPFCKQACHYCDFHFSTNQEKKADMVKALGRELVMQRSYLEHETVNTLYFGGGTPSLLTADEITWLMNVVRDHYALATQPEVTLEANPDDLSPAFLDSLRTAGVNRLSIGIQSFDDDVLQFLNRAHNSISARQCVDDARKAGFFNISIDLIYAIPGQRDSTWEQNIRQALTLQPEHISSYSLTIEDKTAFGRWSASGKLKAEPDETAARQLETLVSLLESAGYEQYEVSNFAREGFQSQHNSSYWKQHKYLGIGPSAHSYNGISRQYNVSNNHEYLRAIGQERIAFTLETLSREDKVNDYLLTTLRTAWGANLPFLKAAFGYDVLAEHPSYLDTLFKQKLAVLEKDTLRLTKAGKLLADKVASDLFLLP